MNCPVPNLILLRSKSVGSSYQLPSLGPNILTIEWVKPFSVFESETVKVAISELLTVGTASDWRLINSIFGVTGEIVSTLKVTGSVVSDVERCTPPICKAAVISYAPFFTPSETRSLRLKSTNGTIASGLVPEAGMVFLSTVCATPPIFVVKTTSSPTLAPTSFINTRSLPASNSVPFKTSDSPAAGFSADVNI